MYIPARNRRLLSGTTSFSRPWAPWPAAAVSNVRLFPGCVCVFIRTPWTRYHNVRGRRGVYYYYLPNPIFKFRRTHRSTALINSGIGTDSHFNLASDTHGVPSGCRAAVRASTAISPPLPLSPPFSWPQGSRDARTTSFFFFFVTSVGVENE